MPISILTPAFRPTYLRQSIASALTQGIEDFELVISDDSGGSDILPVVEQFRDPRIRYHRTSGRIGSAANCVALWELARHRRMIFLLDDDLLLPNALVELNDEADRHPEASLVFGLRHIIDKDGRITREAVSREKVLLDTRATTRSLVGRISNPIGEVTNVLINRASGLQVEDLVSYRGLTTRVVADVGFYLNASRRGPLVGVPRAVAAFRRHGAQDSSPEFNPKYIIGIGEWEIFLRGEITDGRLQPGEAPQAIDRLLEHYVHFAPRMPQIERLTPGLRALKARVANGETAVFDTEFVEAWQAFVDSVLQPAG